MSETFAPVALAEARPASVVTEGRWIRWLLIGIAILFLALFLVLPLLTVFAQAFAKGFAAYLAAFTEADAHAAIRLTLLTAAIAVPFNLVFGIMASWAIAKFEFFGKNLLVTLIDLPFSVSPVVSVWLSIKQDSSVLSGSSSLH